jgi:hypothetical protein
MNRERVGEERGSKETSRCPLTITTALAESLSFCSLNIVSLLDCLLQVLLHGFILSSVIWLMLSRANTELDY